MSATRTPAVQPPAARPDGSKQASPVIVALDGMDEPRALALAERLAGQVWGFKVNDLLLRGGIGVVERLKRLGRVFADPKLYDIPNTVANQVAALEEAGADLITLHCSGGAEMMAAALAARQNSRLLGVTVLTAMRPETVRAVYGQEAPAMVERLARLALAAGLDGVVCSPLELGLLDGLDPERKMLRVTPGVRPVWHGADDQQRVATPAAALAQGASLLVVGRPITHAQDPLQAALRLNNELA